MLPRVGKTPGYYGTASGIDLLYSQMLHNGHLIFYRRPAQMLGFVEGCGRLVGTRYHTKRNSDH
jgi:hypothetical protein